MDQNKINRALIASVTLNQAQPISDSYLHNKINELIEDKRSKTFKGIFESFSLEELVRAREIVNYQEPVETPAPAVIVARETFPEFFKRKVQEWLRKLRRTT